jgi:general secretion pathway protein G
MVLIESTNSETNPPPPRPVSNSPALWALILGIASLVLSPVIIGGLLGIVAIILAIIGLTRPGRKGLAVSGLVTAIVSLPIALITLLFWIGFFIGMSGVKVDNTLRIRAEGDLSQLHTSLATFEVHVGRYPTTEEGLGFLIRNPSQDPTWKGPYLDRLPVDPWGHDYVYLGNGTTFDLFSAGPDGDPHNSDDVSLH